MRRLAAIAALAAVALAIAAFVRALTVGLQADAAMGSATRSLLARAGRSILASAAPQRAGGVAWRSAIQAPHFHADRDVGAGGILVALLGLYDRTHQPAYLTAARRAGDWLLATAEHPRPGLSSWPDWHDARAVAGTTFTSFDDGAPGIADALWRLAGATSDPRYGTAALEGIRWVAAKALPVAGRPCPQQRCRWPYFDDETDDVRTGLGEGQAGIAYGLLLFAERTHDARLMRYAKAAAADLEHEISRLGAIPERPEGTGVDTGFLSGNAGQAYLFLRLWHDTRERRWLADARRLLAWVRAQARPQRHGIAWPIEVGSAAHRNDDLATGFEEGAAGIGWVELQAYRVTRDRRYLRTAEAAGRWLRSAARSEGGGLAWPETAGAQTVHVGLDNGAAGIGWFLHDLALEGGGAANQTAARAAERWLLSVSAGTRPAPVWSDERTGRGWRFRGEPSWHWGSAGVAAFAARMAGWGLDMPGEEEAIPGPPAHGARAAG